MKLISLGVQLHEGLFKGRFHKVKNAGFMKPKAGTGFWTSTYTPADESQSDWIRWCISEETNFLKGQGFLFEVHASARVLCIDSVADLQLVASRYPSPTQHHSFDLLDFEAIAKEYDGLHLTEKGQWRTRFGKPSLYGWDCESTLWFNMNHLLLVESVKTKIPVPEMSE